MHSVHKEGETMKIHISPKMIALMIQNAKTDRDWETLSS